MAKQQEGAAPAESPHVDAPAAEPPKLTEAEQKAEVDAKEAKGKLALLRVTSSEKVVVASPNAGWSLSPGVNHFDGELPEPVVKRFVELQAKQLITVELLDGDGKSSPWPKPATPTT